jgi:hypothetical protein
VRVREKVEKKLHGVRFVLEMRSINTFVVMTACISHSLIIDEVKRRSCFEVNVDVFYVWLGS